MIRLRTYSFRFAEQVLNARLETKQEIDVGVYIVTTRQFQKTMISEHKQKWEGSLTFEKVEKYLPHFKSAIQVPIYLVGIDL